MMQPLFAVHISEGMLNWSWRIAGAIATIVVVFLTSRRLRDDEIPRIALLTAVFFVASSIHVRVGPTSVHLILNGLVGVILGYRCALAILVSLILQFALIAHGGLTTLGVNFCVMTLPALLARPLYQYLMARASDSSFRWRDTVFALAFLLHPYCLAAIVVALLLWHAALGCRWPMTASFRAGFCTGFATLLLTVIFNGVALVAGGVEDWRIFAALVIATHIPIALIEGVIVGFTTSFLESVKPELLRFS